MDAAAERHSELITDLPVGRTLRRRPERNPFGALGPPSATWANIHVQLGPATVGTATSCTSGRGWRELLDGLTQDQPARRHPSTWHRWTEGKAVNRWASVVVGVRRLRDVPCWVLLYLTGPRQYVAWPESAAVQHNGSCSSNGGPSGGTRRIGI